MLVPEAKTEPLEHISSIDLGDLGIFTCTAEPLYTLNTDSVFDFLEGFCFFIRHLYYKYSI